MKFTAVYVNGNQGWIVALVEEFGVVVVQGRTIEQTRERVREAMTILMEEYREVATERLIGHRILTREEFTVEGMTFSGIFVEGERGYVGAVVEQLPMIWKRAKDIDRARRKAIDAVRTTVRVNRAECIIATADRPRILLREVLTTDDDTADA